MSYGFNYYCFGIVTHCYTDTSGKVYNYKSNVQYCCLLIEFQSRMIKIKIINDGGDKNKTITEHVYCVCIYYNIYYL